jgi:transposase
VKPHVELKEKARALYLEGKSYRKIHIELGVSKSSISLWCRDLVEEKLKSGDP